jgi:hypothetical protein
MRRLLLLDNLARRATKLVMLWQLCGGEESEVQAQYVFHDTHCIAIKQQLSDVIWRFGYGK